MSTSLVLLDNVTGGVLIGTTWIKARMQAARILVGKRGEYTKENVEKPVDADTIRAVLR